MTIKRWRVILESNWKFIDTGHLSAAMNMAMDECLLNWHSEGKIPPTLRFYGWKKPSLSLGYFQRSRTIDLDAVEKHGCEFVRRLTGGSAVLHDDELTYSLVISEDDPGIPKSVTKAYYILTQGVLEGYKNLGIETEFAIPEREVNREQSAICFEKPSFYEMVVDGRKICGNAQTRKKGVLLQHGSLPMSLDTDMLFDLFAFSTDKARQRRKENFANKAISIKDVTDKQFTYEEMTVAFKKGFEKGLNIALEPLHLSDEQWDEVKQLAETKYGTDSWNMYTSKERETVGKI